MFEGAPSRSLESLTALFLYRLSPIPLAYSIHLRQVIWIYLLFLPTQLRATFGWLVSGSLSCLVRRES